VSQPSTNLQESIKRSTAFGSYAAAESPRT
jgi:hypothetical protein